jgi:hypothetical protein
MKTIEEVLDFWNDGLSKSAFSIDREDFQRSKNFASGNGFYMVDSKVWSAQRARIYADFISPVVAGIVSMFELAPPEIQNYELDRKTMSDALREILNDGKSFMLAYNEGGSLKVKRLSNLQTYMSEDCSKALHLSKITAAQAEKRGASFRGPDRSLIDSFAATLPLGANETYLLTAYELTEDGVEIAEFIGREQAGKAALLKLGRLPIVPFFGDPVFIQNKPNFRGIYYKAKDVLITISFILSYIQEKIATAPNAQFSVSEEALGDNPQQWTEMNGEPRALITYKARDTLDGGAVVNPPPQRVDQSLYIAEPLQALAAFQEILRGIMGGDMAGEARSHETAESVLLRREKKDASGNAYIRSMLSSLDTLAEVLTEYSALIGQPRECKVVDRYLAKMKQREDFQTISQLMQRAEKSPAFAALLAEKTDLDDADKAKAAAAIDAAGAMQKAAALQAQAEQNAALIQSMQRQIQDLANAKAALEVSKQEQVYAAEIRSQTDIQRTLIQNETELMKLEIQSEKNSVDVALRFQDMNRKAEEALLKLKRDIVKYNPGGITDGQ